jgi:hypothetical protein
MHKYLKNANQYFRHSLFFCIITINQLFFNCKLFLTDYKTMMNDMYFIIMNVTIDDSWNLT